jgi:hypothetical protein
VKSCHADILHPVAGKCKQNLASRVEHHANACI